MLRACLLEFVGSWDSKLHLMEFSYNNCYQATIGMVPYEKLCGKRCRTPLCWDEVGERELVGPNWSKLRMRRCKRSEKGCALLRVDRKAMRTQDGGI